ncbi:YhfC family intramembrane metalloprotease [Metabacillus sp. RGM 3146]|uniref:YhfC family intramembrane metalloprotease n=1 Tax=Metabacillus sp. RGM 3146 TaxID=3401092 RepID=UPI003B9926A9
MVSQSVIAGYIFSIILSVGFPIFAFIYLKRKERILFRPVLTGSLIFIFFALVLEGSLNFYLLNINESTKVLKTNSYLFSLYGALAAGVFEETGRYVAFAWLLKKYRDRKDGLAYGLGHGGIESIFLGGFASVQYIILANVVNTGGLDNHSIPGAAAIKASILNITADTSFSVGIDRILSFFIQVALSLLVLYAVKNKKFIHFLLAILIHTAIDFVAVLGVIFKFNPFVMDLYLLAVAIGAVIYIRKTKEASNISEEKPSSVEMTEDL